jgi:hypothetical protein
MAEMLWCWRCQMEVAMLDAEESKKASEIYSQSFKEGGILVMRKAMLEYYNEVTGWKETNVNAALHHIASLYGPPCEKCGKPYRTPQAKLCGACMHRRGEPVR